MPPRRENFIPAFFSPYYSSLACADCDSAFEFVNGFHDTANASLTVLYTRLRYQPTIAVVWSGFSI